MVWKLSWYALYPSLGNSLKKLSLLPTPATAFTAIPLKDSMLPDYTDLELAKLSSKSIPISFPEKQPLTTVKSTLSNLFVLSERTCWQQPRISK